MKKRVLCVSLLLLLMAGGAFALDFGIDVAMPVGGGIGAPWFDFLLGFSKIDVFIGVVPPLSFGTSFAMGFRGGVSLKGATVGNAVLSFPLYASMYFGPSKKGNSGSAFDFGFWGGGRIDYSFSRHLGVFAKAAVQAIGIDVDGSATFGFVNSTETELGVVFRF